MVLFSAGFWYAFSSGEYSSKAKPQKQPMNFFKAIFDAANPLELILGVLRIPMLLSARGQTYAPVKYGAGYDRPYGQPAYGQPAYVGRDVSLEEGGYGGYGPNMYNAPPGPPPTYPAANDQSRTHLMADGRKSRTPAPGR